MERSSGHTRDLGSESRGNGITNVGGGESTEDGVSVFGRNLTDGFDVVEFSIDGFLVVNSDGNGKVSSNLVISWSKFGFSLLGDEFSFDSDGFTFSVFGNEFWNNNTNGISGSSNVQFGEEVGNIKSVLGGVSRFQKGVDGVLSEVSLSSFSFWGSDWVSNWSVFAWSFAVLVEEFTKDGHLEDVVSGEGWSSSDLRVVSGNTSKIWDGFLDTVLNEILVDGSINDGSNLSLNLFDNGWDN